MATGETGKQKVGRIEQDYHTRQDRVYRWRRWLCAGVVPPTLIWLAWGALHPAQHHSPGKLAAAHASWDNQCAACHVDVLALGGDAWIGGLSSAETDAKCQTCHAGPVHHAASLAGEDHCIACHQDHRGRDAPISRVADSFCTRCHADLGTHTARNTTLAANPHEPYENVTRFDFQNHPPFRSARGDPGNLKFSHRRHLAAGLNLGKDDQFGPRRWRDLTEMDRGRFQTARASDDDLIQLSCTSCHRLDESDLPAAARDSAAFAESPQRSAGEYMIPITYEKHCRACHPLTIDESMLREAIPKGGQRICVPHGLSPEQLSKVLSSEFAAQFLKTSPDLLQQHVPQHPLPGQPLVEEPFKARQFIDNGVRGIEKYVQGRCAECHEVPDPVTKTPAATTPIAPTRVPSVWLKHARFDHAAHRAVSCQQCHQAEYLYQPWRPGEQESALDHDNVLIPNIDVCVTCHAPPSGSTQGGARFDCVECHTYHAGDLPFHGPGSKRWDVQRKLRIEEFLNGPNAR